jgi:ribosomal protein S18 acetylase RimI-like enzyme
MEINSLEKIDFSELMECFLKAFDNYFVKMPVEHEFYKKRWEMANVRLDLSYGMFDNGKLVGFIINAIDRRNGDLIAFNTGTGVLLNYRGKRIVYKIYKYAIPKLLKEGITKCKLEVIKDNNIALKLYQNIGFEITKSYKCYSGAILLKKEVPSFEIEKVNEHYFDWNKMCQENYSWDNHINTIKKGVYNYYAIIVLGKLSAYFIINPDNGYLAQFNVFNNSNNWNVLFEAIKQVSKTIKINNVDEKLENKIKCINTIGLNNTIDQYEMEWSIN